METKEGVAWSRQPGVVERSLMSGGTADDYRKEPGPREPLVWALDGFSLVVSPFIRCSLCSCFDSQPNLPLIL